MDIKKQLISEIEKIEDVLILEQLTALVKNANELTEVQFNNQQLSDIDESITQINDGKFFTHEEVMKTIKNA